MGGSIGGIGPRSAVVIEGAIGTVRNKEKGMGLFKSVKYMQYNSTPLLYGVLLFGEERVLACEMGLGWSGRCLLGGAALVLA
ncbi:uncharacterized protein N7458_006481 [Penicillium daleae]|uniref:Uncharacterized protein n=1 Tax=Penicillium daleae TaxID=63821 RepID=A0AAD6C4C7_9EURO|nr:uncharacterized protein N7458_006481 [Penicillium daleae]KAJ5450032.1 hypothetical protein N7458_006481 [Penicillium daleae]